MGHVRRTLQQTFVSSATFPSFSARRVPGIGYGFAGFMLRKLSARPQRRWTGVGYGSGASPKSNASSTLTVNVQAAVFPEESVAVACTTFVPLANVEPLGGVKFTGTLASQLSVAVALYVTLLLQQVPPLPINSLEPDASRTYIGDAKPK